MSVKVVLDIIYEPKFNILLHTMYLYFFVIFKYLKFNLVHCIYVLSRAYVGLRVNGQVSIYGVFVAVLEIIEDVCSFLDIAVQFPQRWIFQQFSLGMKC